MVATIYENPMKALFEDESRWLYYTDIYQRFQFRYPACFSTARLGKKIRLSFDPNGQGCIPTSPWTGCRFSIYKLQPFHDTINLEEYLMFEERQRKLPFTKERTLLTDLQHGYRGVRAVRNQPDGMILSIIMLSYQTSMLPIHAVIRDGLDLDIQLAHSVRFF